jgi:hypothetical protein
MRSFRPVDYVSLKIDVEGMQYERNPSTSLCAGGVQSTSYIDELAVEFHPRIKALEVFADQERFFMRLLEASGVVVHEHCQSTHV